MPILKNLIMKKLFILIVLIGLLQSCCSIDEPKPKKPFVIYDMGYSNNSQRKSGWCWYEYVDDNGERFHFTSKYGEYHIGDTIK